MIPGAAGARVLSGGTRISDTRYAPTVLYDPPEDVRVSTQEVFGPVVCVYPYDDLDHAIGRANALPCAFQAAVFTRDINLALRAYARLDASAVMVNDHTAFRVDWMPPGSSNPATAWAGSPTPCTTCRSRRCSWFTRPSFERAGPRLRRRRERN